MTPLGSQRSLSVLVFSASFALSLSPSCNEVINAISLGIQFVQKLSKTQKTTKHDPKSDPESIQKLCVFLDLQIAKTLFPSTIPV